MWNKQNAARRLAISARYRSGHAEKISAYNREYTKRPETREKFKLAKIARRVAQKALCPAWANRAAIVEIYKFARQQTKALGEVHSVDHIVPLKHPLVCGLHVEHNLRVIPQRENASKGNRWWPDMPE